MTTNPNPNLTKHFYIKLNWVQNATSKNKEYITTNENPYTMPPPEIVHIATSGNWEHMATNENQYIMPPPEIVHIATNGNCEHMATNDIRYTMPPAKIWTHCHERKSVYTSGNMYTLVRAVIEYILPWWKSNSQLRGTECIGIYLNSNIIC